MNSKYYVPELSEFHVGFEIEIWHPNSDNRDGFDSEVYDELTPVLWNRLIETMIKEKEVRVKYLDREDIESLGFRHYNISYPDRNHLWFCEVDAEIANENTIWIGLGFYNNEKSNYIIKGAHPKVYWNNQGDCLFLGDIKNKSELGRILRQAGYER